MRGAVRPAPAERIANHSGQHGRGGKITHRANLIDRHASEGHQRRYEVQNQPTMVHDVDSAAGKVFAQPAKSASEPRSAPGTSAFTKDITRRFSPVA